MIEQVVVAGSVMTKGVSGVLIPLGFEYFLSAVDTRFLYNLICVAILFVIAAMSGPRSEAAFCIVTPLFAGIFMWVGWLRLATATQTQHLAALVACMFVFGIILYMKDQNRVTFGIVGPGSPVFNIALYLVFFNIALTLVSGFTVFPLGPTQPIPGTCSVGFTCDEYNNIDFTTTSNSLSNAGGGLTSPAGMLVWTGEMLYGMFKVILNILIGVFVLPLVLNQTVAGIMPWLVTNTVWLAFMVVLEVVILVVYALSLYEHFAKPMPNTGSV